MNGSGPFLGGVTVGGGLSNVTPRTVGETDGVMVPPPAGHALLLGLVVGNSVLSVKGTTSRLGCIESGLGLADGMAMTLDEALPSALAVATRIADAQPASAVLNASSAIVRNLGSLNLARVTQVTAHNPGRRWEEAVKRAGALRSRHCRNLRRPARASRRPSCTTIVQAPLRWVSPHRSPALLSSRRPSRRGA